MEGTADYRQSDDQMETQSETTNNSLERRANSSQTSSFLCITLSKQTYVFRGPKFPSLTGTCSEEPTLFSTSIFINSIWPELFEGNYYEHSGNVDGPLIASELNCHRLLLFIPHQPGSSHVCVIRRNSQHE